MHRVQVHKEGGLSSPVIEKVYQASTKAFLLPKRDRWAWPENWSVMKDVKDFSTKPFFDLTADKHVCIIKAGLGRLDNSLDVIQPRCYCRV